MIHDLREMILSQIPEAIETDRAEPDLLAVSLQSTMFPNRHIWAYTRDGKTIKIDIEDWETDQEWDHAIRREATTSLETAIQIIQKWLAANE